MTELYMPLSVGRQIIGKNWPLVANRLGVGSTINLDEKCLNYNPGQYVLVADVDPSELVESMPLSLHTDTDLFCQVCNTVKPRVLDFRHRSEGSISICFDCTKTAIGPTAEQPSDATDRSWTETKELKEGDKILLKDQTNPDLPDGVYEVKSVVENDSVRAVELKSVKAKKKKACKCKKNGCTRRPCTGSCGCKKCRKKFVNFMKTR